MFRSKTCTRRIKMSCKIKCGDCNCGKHASRQNCRNRADQKVKMNLLTKLNQQKIRNSHSSTSNSSMLICRNQLQQCRNELSNAFSSGKRVSIVSTSNHFSKRAKQNGIISTTGEKCELKCPHVWCDYWYWPRECGHQLYDSTIEQTRVEYN